MIDRGSGIPVVLIPGIQGRWEWLAPAVDALADRFRVLTFSLCDEPTSGFAFDPLGGFGCYVEQVNDAMRRAGVTQAIVIGSSYSGLVATEFALRYPERVMGVVLASALPPGWTPNRRARFYLRAPRLLSPLFAITSPIRMLPEVNAALPVGARTRFVVSCGYRVLRAMVSPTRMAQRIRFVQTFQFSDPSAAGVPALIVTGEDRLDRIVSTAETRQYLARLPRARHVVLPGTGHLGIVTKPVEFAERVRTFVDEIAADARRISA